MDLNAQWVVGFIDGVGCFDINFRKTPTMPAEFQVIPEFSVVQSEVNVHVLYALKTYFGCGVVRKHQRTNFYYRVRGQKNLMTRIIPFFEKHKLKTRKSVDFVKFRKVLLLIEKEEDLKPEGLNKIWKIKGSMINKSRKGKYGTSKYDTAILNSLNSINSTTNSKLS